MDSLKFRLLVERRHVIRLVAGAAIAVALAVPAAGLAAGAFLLGEGRWLVLPRALPSLLWLTLFLLALLGAILLRRRLSPSVSLEALAARIERERSLRHGSLRGALEVAEQSPLGALAAELQVRELERISGSVLAPQFVGRLQRLLFLAGALATTGMVCVLVARRVVPDGWAAATDPLGAWTGRLWGGVKIERVPPAVLRGERLTISVRAPGRRSVELAYRRTGHPWERVAVPLRGDTGSAVVGPVDADLAVFATDGRARSDTVSVRMVERPYIAEVRLQARFPAYLRRQSETLPVGEPLRLPRGTVLSISGLASAQLTAVSLHEGRDTVRLATSGYGFSGEWAIGRSGRYQWSAVTNGTSLLDVPAPLDIEILADSVPSVAIVAPGGDTTVSRGDSLRVSILASDDHGLLQIGMRSWIRRGVRDADRDTTVVLASVREPQWSGGTSISTEFLQPGDALHLVAWAIDGSPWAQRSESREIVVRLPTLAEQRALARQAADSALAQAASTVAAQRELEQRTTVAARDRGNRQSGNTDASKNASGERPMQYEAAERARALAQEQRQLAQRVAQLKEAAREAEQRLRSAGALDSALQERFQEVQQLLREALTEELADRLRELEAAAAKLSQDDTRRALADLAEQQRQLRQQLERSVEMLKRAALEGAMSTLRDEAQELAEKERQLVDSLARARQPDEGHRSQAEEMAERARELAEAMRALEERLRKERAQAGPARVAEAQRQAQESARELERVRESKTAAEDSRSATGQARDSTGSSKGSEATARSPARAGTQASSAEEAARRAAEAMEAAANQLAQARRQQVDEWKQELAAELDRSVQEMLQLARQQEALQNQVRAGTAPSDVRSQQGALQQGVEASTQRLQEASQRSSLISPRTLRAAGEARRMVAEATRQAQAGSNGSQVASAMQEATQALTGAAASLIRDRQRVESASSASGFAEMLRELEEAARQQSALNSAVQQLVPLPGQQARPDAQQRARELSRQQRDVASRLEDVADRDLAGRTEELAREARQIAQALAVAQLDRSVIERQQRLFKRMLDAGRVLEEDERDDSGKREARSWSGSEVFRPSDSEVRGRDAIRFRPPTWEELRGLSPDERRMVLEYFRRLNGTRP